MSHVSGNIARLTKIQWVRHAGRKTAGAAAKPERVVNWRAFNILALGCGIRHRPLVVAPYEHESKQSASVGGERAERCMACGNKFGS